MQRRRLAPGRFPRLLFRASTDATEGGGLGRELWRCDGTAAGPRALGDRWAGYRASSPNGFTRPVSDVLFAANDPSSARQD